MIGGRRVLCVVPVRAGSKGVPGKNMRPLGGKPLLSHTLETVRRCDEIDRTVVSTDSEALADVAARDGFPVPFLRPIELASDDAGTIDVLLHAMDFVESEEGPYDLVLLLHATCPFRTVDDVRACLRLVADEGAESAFTVTAAHGNPYFNMVEVDNAGVSLCKEAHFGSRQQAPKVYEINGAAYVWPWETLRSAKAVILPGSRVHVMPRERSVDIDEELDFRIAECLIARGEGETA